MGTDTTRVPCARADLALPSDLANAEWALLKPYFPPASHAGRPRKWPMRRIVEAIQHMLRGDLRWRMPPPCFPPVSTVRRWFYLWLDSIMDVKLNREIVDLWHAVDHEGEILES